MARECVLRSVQFVGWLDKDGDATLSSIADGQLSDVRELDSSVCVQQL